MNTQSNLVFKDEKFSFYLSETDRRGVLLLEILDSYNRIVFSHMFLANFGNNPVQKVFHGKSGTYSYYKFTAKCDNIVQELVLLEQSPTILKPIYLDSVYADSSTSRLVVTTTKGGLKVIRVVKPI